MPYIVFIFCFFSLLASTTAQAAGGSCLPANEYRVAIGGVEHMPPIGYPIDSGNKLPRRRYILDGLAPRLLVKILDELKLTNRDMYAKGSYEAAEKKAHDNRMDILYGHYHSNSPYSIVDDIYPAFFNNPVSVMVRRDRIFPVGKKEDLKPYKGVVAKHEKFGEFFTKFMVKDLDIDTVATHEEAFRRLIHEEVDYVLTSYYVGQAYAYQFGLTRYLDFAAKDIFSEKMFISFPKTTPCKIHTPFFKKKIKGFKEDGTLKKMLIDIMREFQRKYAGKLAPPHLRPNNLGSPSKPIEIKSAEEMPALESEPEKPAPKTDNAPQVTP